MSGPSNRRPATLGLALLLCSPWACRLPKVPFAVTSPEVVADMLRLAEVKRDDVVYDLGCGDGRIVIAAAQLGARGVGVEIDVRFVRIAEERARAAGVADRTRFVHSDLFDADIREATVVAVYLLPETLDRLRPKLLRELRTGARVVSNSFGLGDWHPDIATPIGGPRIFVWVVPADVSGEWRWEDGSLHIEQRFQEVTAKLELGGRSVPVLAARLRGDRLRLTAPGAETLEGRVSGGAMELTSGARRWTARRVRPGPPLAR